MSDLDDFLSPPPASPPPRKRAVPSGCAIAAGLAAAGVVVAALIIAFAIQQATGSMTSALSPGTPTIVARPPAINQVQALADLTTSSVLMSTIVEAKQARIGKIVYEKLVLLACGKVKAGIDLGKLKEDDVVSSADGVTVTVRLPKAEILDTYLVDEADQPCTTRVYDRTNLILIPAAKDLESQAREQAVEAIRKTAEQSGILDEAQRNAQAVIERMLMLAGYKAVVFVPVK